MNLSLAKLTHRNIMHVA